MSRKSFSNPRIWIGLLLIVLGGLFLLDNYGIIYFEIPNFLFRWQSIIIIIGLIAFISSGNKIPGVIFISIGLLGFFPQFWPLLLIGVGIYIIFRTKNQKGWSIMGEDRDDTSASGTNQTLNDVSLFGGGKKILHGDNFAGGKITAIFGGSEIDLRDCKLADGENLLDIIAMFGGTTIIAPSDWEIIIDLIPIFGGFSDNRRKEPLTDSNSRGVLTIRGFVIFGGGEIKN